MSEDQLIFIISQPRAGSTFLQGLLNDNNRIVTCPEPWFLFPFANCVQPTQQYTYFNYDWYKEASSEFVKNQVGESNFKKGLSEFLKSIYFNEVHATYFLDKTPRYYEILQFIIEIFPDAKIILLKRNPSDVLRSMISTWRIDSLKALSLFKRDLLLAPKIINDFLNRNKSNPNVIEVKYENLVKNTEKEMRRLISFLNLKWKNEWLCVRSEEIKGVFGDPKLLKQDHNRNMLRPLNEKSVNDLVSGYLYFLGKDFLREYGGYQNQTMHQTVIFKKFLWLNGCFINRWFKYYFNIFSRNER